MSVKFEKPEAVQITSCGGRTTYWTKNKIISLVLVLLILFKLAIIYVFYMLYYGLLFCDNNDALDKIASASGNHNASISNSSLHSVTSESSTHPRIASQESTEPGIEPTVSPTAVTDSSTPYVPYDKYLELSSEDSMINQDSKYRCGRRMIENVNFTEAPHINTYFGQFPWMLVLLKHNARGAEYRCGASLVAPDVALTAAHCVGITPPGTQAQGLYSVQAGDWYLGGVTEDELLPTESRDIVEVHVHVNYNQDTYENDIALLRLGSEIGYSEHIRPICLPDWNVQYDPDKCVLSGWGKDGQASQYKYHMYLRQVGLSLILRDACEAKLQETRLGKYYQLSSGSLCAWNASADVNSCKGDGGSPLVCPVKGDPDLYVQVGIALWSIDCNPAVPDIYSDVEYYRDWIDETLTGWSKPEETWTDVVE